MDQGALGRSDPPIPWIACPLAQAWPDPSSIHNKHPKVIDLIQGDWPDLNPLGALRSIAI